MKRLLLLFMFLVISISAQEIQQQEPIDTSKTEVKITKEKPLMSLTEMQYYYNAQINYDWNNTYLSSQPFTFSNDDLPPLFPTGKELLSPLRRKYKSDQKYKLLYQVIGTLGTAAAIGVATQHIIKYKDEYKKDFK